MVPYMLAVAIVAYHGIRNECSNLFLVARNIGDFREVHKHVITSASYHWHEMRPASWGAEVPEYRDRLACGSANPVMTYEQTAPVVRPFVA